MKWSGYIDDSVTLVAETHTHACGTYTFKVTRSYPQRGIGKKSNLNGGLVCSVKSITHIHIHTHTLTLSVSLYIACVHMCVCVFIEKHFLIFRLQILFQIHFIIYNKPWITDKGNYPIISDSFPKMTLKWYNSKIWLWLLNKGT